MIPVNNVSKYHRTVAVYVDDESLIIVLASACKWPIKAIFNVAACARILRVSAINF